LFSTYKDPPLFFALLYINVQNSIFKSYPKLYIAPPSKALLLIKMELETFNYSTFLPTKIAPPIALNLAIINFYHQACFKKI
jgi:hypothetical protein